MSADNSDDLEKMVLKHTHANANINQLVQVAVIDTMSTPGTKALRITDEEIRLQKLQVVDKTLAMFLKIPHKITYEEITKFDEPNRIFTMETHLKMPSQHRNEAKRRLYEIHISTEFAENDLGKVDVETQIYSRGIPRNGVMHMGIKAQVEQRFRDARQAEAVALLAK
jgi:hypothetical protein